MVPSQPHHIRINARTSVYGSNNKISVDIATMSARLSISLASILETAATRQRLVQEPEQDQEQEQQQQQHSTPPHTYHTTLVPAAQLQKPETKLRKLEIQIDGGITINGNGNTVIASSPAGSTGVGLSRELLQRAHTRGYAHGVMANRIRHAQARAYTPAKPPPAVSLLAVPVGGKRKREDDGGELKLKQGVRTGMRDESLITLGGLQESTRLSRDGAGRSGETRGADVVTERVKVE